jgi:hypothetical protein
MSTPGNIGPLGRPRGVGFGILMFIVTLGFYSWYWIFKTQEEMKQHTGEGLGGVLGLVIWIVLHPVMAFVTPSEIGAMYKRRGRHHRLPAGQACGSSPLAFSSFRRSSGS